MNRNKTWIGIALVGALLWLSDAATARAELSECGGVFLSEGANCEYRKTEQCMTECTTTAVETACVAKLYTSCENQCTTSASTSCESTCSQGCTTNCQTQVATPEPPNCMGLCVSDCQQSCEDGGRGRRGGCCSHTCNDRCEDKCKDVVAEPTNAEQCTTTCMNACSGSCTAKVNVECQLNCQTSTYTQCETELVETCETKCMDEGGAIFCDGQFVNAASARSCADQLKATFDFNINVEATVTAVGDTAGDAVDATKEKSDDLCTVRAPGAGHGAKGTLALLGLCASVLTVQRLRKRRSSSEKR